MFDNLSKILEKDIRRITFKDSTYLKESFFEESIKQNFAGWFQENELIPHLELILKECNISRKSKILDLGCGHGRYSELLSENGHDVTGVDFSEKLISFLKDKYKNKIIFTKSDMGEVVYENAFDLIIILGNSLSLIPIDKCKVTLKNMYRSLKPGGKIFIELDNKHYFIENDANKKRWNYYQNRWVVLSEHYYDEKGCFEKTRDISFDLENNDIGEYLFVKRLYDFDEISKLMEESRLKVNKIMGDWNGNDYNETLPNLLVVGEKN